MRRPNDSYSIGSSRGGNAGSEASTDDDAIPEEDEVEEESKNEVESSADSRKKNLKSKNGTRKPPTNKPKPERAQSTSHIKSPRKVQAGTIDDKITTSDEESGVSGSSGGNENGGKVAKRRKKPKIVPERAMSQVHVRGPEKHHSPRAIGTPKKKAQT